MSRFDTEGKNAVRDLWNTPVLRYLHESYGIKFRYFGLPGVDILDLSRWKGMIEDVIAFELPYEGRDGDERKNIIELKRKLELIDIPYKVYYGSLEQVIFYREDLERNRYKQEKLINLYNLDFCSEITSKAPTCRGRECLRFELIRQLLHDQHECYKELGGDNWFFLLLTTRNQTNSAILTEYLLKRDLDVKTHEFITRANAGTNVIPEEPIPLIGTHGWALKAFVFDLIAKSYFQNPAITSLVFPMLKYNGKPVDSDIPSPMMHWMFLCKFEDPHEAKPLIYPDNFIFTQSLLAGKEGIGLNAEPGEDIESALNPLDLLTKYEELFLHEYFARRT